MLTLSLPRLEWELGGGGDRVTGGGGQLYHLLGSTGGITEALCASSLICKVRV